MCNKKIKNEVPVLFSATQLMSHQRLQFESQFGKDFPGSYDMCENCGNSSCDCGSHNYTSSYWMGSKVETSLLADDQKTTENLIKRGDAVNCDYVFCATENLKTNIEVAMHFKDTKIILSWNPIIERWEIIEL